MTQQHFSTKALLKIALEVESSHGNSSKSRYFNLDKLNLIILRNDYIIDERAAKVLWLRFERDMTIDEIVNELNSPAHIIRASLKDSITRIHCFSLVYRSPSTRDIDCVAYDLIKEGTMYAELFGPQSYERAACDFIRNGRKFDLQISRAHATIVALTLGFSGRELDDRFVSFAKILAKEKFELSDLQISFDEKHFDRETEIVGNVDLDALQEYLDFTLDRKVKIIRAEEIKRV